MRIIAGARKGLRLEVPAGQTVRPTPDRAREGLMSALGGFFDGELVLDLCAGSGAMALEALSRGCAAAVLVERDPAAAACIERNVARAQMGERARLLRSDVRDALTVLRNGGERFDLIFFDPPYDGRLYRPILANLADGALLRAGAEVIVESRSGLAEQDLSAAWRPGPLHRYSSTILQRLRRADGALDR